MSTLTELESRIAAIEARNQRVTSDKAWETSWTRKLSIAVLTYFVVVILLMVLHRDQPWINAIIPVIGFLLSTLAVGWIKALWTHRRTRI
ncbi:MAG TPA: hypothetical protein VLF67_02045 [Candidatus Saccharimonas sp.]|nr:hypothetical protein [Candidatus Saccharimonas sp.]